MISASPGNTDEFHVLAAFSAALIASTAFSLLLFQLWEQFISVKVAI